MQKDHIPDSMYNLVPVQYEQNVCHLYNIAYIAGEFGATMFKYSCIDCFVCSLGLCKVVGWGNQKIPRGIGMR